MYVQENEITTFFTYKLHVNNFNSVTNILANWVQSNKLRSPPWLITDEMLTKDKQWGIE
jgi:hypothetical protein